MKRANAREYFRLIFNVARYVIKYPDISAIIPTDVSNTTPTDVSNTTPKDTVHG